MVPRNHPLASVREAFNAVFVEADSAGDLMFYGQGAGGEPTASAVLGDLVTAARHRVTGSRGPAASTYKDLTISSIRDAMTSYYVSLRVDDVPGVLATIAGIFAAHGVSIAGVRQDGQGDEARLVVRSHAAREGAMQDTLAELEHLPAVQEVAGAMRVLDLEAR